MGISHYLKEIGRGKDGARSLNREQACDLWGQLLDGQTSDLEVGAFCIAMRVKGETAEEMAGFLDATQARLHTIPQRADQAPLVVLPSYNGARKLPCLTPLLGMLLARQGLPVVVHGMASETRRISTKNVLEILGVHEEFAITNIANGQLCSVPTTLLCPGLARLLEVRRTIGLRNPAHSLVKLMNPSSQAAIVVGSYTHPEYALSMAEVFALTGANAMLLHGTEGEPVADLRRRPQMEAFVRGQRQLLCEAQAGSLASIPDMPSGTDASATAAYIQAVLAGEKPVPAPIAQQVAYILLLAKQL